MKIYLRDFLKSDTVNAAVSRAISALSDGDTLCLGGGVWRMTPDGSEKKFYYISNNDKGEKTMGFALIGKKNITVDGEGADLIFSGDILPFSVDECENVTVKNLSIDYADPRYVQARILRADENGTVLDFNETETDVTLENGHLCFVRPKEGTKLGSSSPLVLEFEKDGRPSRFQPTYFADSGSPNKGFLSSLTRSVSYRMIGKNVVEMIGNVGCVHTVGNYWVATCCDRQYPGILIHRSKNITLSNIKLYHTASMGVIGQLSDTITLDHVDAVPRSGRILSVNADATHFVNCRGKLTLSRCKFVRMMDDACNIHGIYLKDPQKCGEHELIMTYGHFQHNGMNIFLPGDRIRISDRVTLKETAVYTVVKSENPDEEHLRVTVKERVAELSTGLAAENPDANPEVLFDGCESGHNRPRGFLIGTSGKTVVENCTFYNMYQGVNVGCEMKHWYESGPSLDVTVRNNRFVDSAYAGGYAINVSPNVENPEYAKDFLGRIVIEGNTFVQNGKRFLHAENVKELIVRNNRFHIDASLSDHGSCNEKGIRIERISHAEIEDVAEE